MMKAVCVVLYLTRNERANWCFHETRRQASIPLQVSLELLCVEFEQISGGSQVYEHSVHDLVEIRILSQSRSLQANSSSDVPLRD